jgi:hypothetical protein
MTWKPASEGRYAAAHRVMGYRTLHYELIPG